MKRTNYDADFRTKICRRGNLANTIAHMRALKRNFVKEYLSLQDL